MPHLLRSSRSISLQPALLLLFLVLSVSPPASVAQQVPDGCIGGTEYYIAFPDTVRNLQDPRFPDQSPESLGLLIYSPVAQTIQISRRAGIPIDLQLRAGEMIDYTNTELLADPIVTERNQVDELSAVHLTSDHPVVVYAYYSTNFGTAGFTPLPVESWGTEYFAASWPGEVIRNVKPAGETNYDGSEKVEAPAQVLVIAAEDDTEITLNPTAALACEECTRFTLDRGEAYLVQSSVDTGDVESRGDIAGTSISATKPIGVVSGNTRTQFKPFSYQMLAGNSPKDLTAEWLTPVTMHGRAFVFTPTLDSLRQGPGRKTMRDVEHVLLLPSVEENTVIRYGPLGGAEVRADPGEAIQAQYGELSTGSLISSSHSTQAFHAIQSVARFNGTTGSGNFIGASYTAWGSAMVEMTPRRRWTSFAPFAAPTIDAGAEHYVTIISDAAHSDDVWLQKNNGPRVRVSFDRPMEDSNTVWAHMAIEPGITYRLYGENGARFTGHLQGGFSGFEMYTPGGTREDDGKGGSSAGVHPSEYEERIAGMYAMPLVGSSCPIRQEDVYLIELLGSGCDGETYRILRLNGGPLDLDYLRVDQARTANMRLEFVEPLAGPQALDTARVAVVRLLRNDPTADASGVIRLRDNQGAGEEVEIVVDLPLQRVEFEPDEIVLEEVSDVVDSSVMLHNRSDAPVDLTTLELAYGDRGFSISGTEPGIRWSDSTRVTVIEPGDSIEVKIRYRPDVQSESLDSLVVNLLCNRLSIPLRGSAAPGTPCIEVGDLDFGLLSLGVERTLPLEICNRGDAVLTFEPNGPGGVLVDWLQKEFTISSADIQILTNMNLTPNQCVTIRVTFRSSEVAGDFRTVARFYTNETDGNCRDSSVWTAQVGTVSVDEESAGTRGLSITSITPNPSSSLLRVAYMTRQHEPLEAELIDATGQVQAIGIERVSHGSTGEFLLDVSILPSGLYFVRLRSEGGEVVRGVTVVR